MGILSCVVVGDGSFYVPYVRDLLVVANGVKPLWRFEVLDFCDPNFFAKGTDGCVEGRKPGGEKQVSVTTVNGATDDQVGVGVSPGV